VDKLLRSIEADERKAQATEHRPGKVTLPADIPGEIIAETVRVAQRGMAATPWFTI
jgi:hypothetical protein